VHAANERTVTVDKGKVDDNHRHCKSWSKRTTTEEQAK